MCVSHIQLTLRSTVIYADYSKQLKQALSTYMGKTTCKQQQAVGGDGQSLRDVDPQLAPAVLLYPFNVHTVNIKEVVKAK